MKNWLRIETWKIYTWVCNWGVNVLELLPMALRTRILGLAFGRLGEHPALIDYKTYFRYPSKIEIGSHVAINRGCMFLASAHSGSRRDIVIGDHCVFGPNVKLLSAGHDYHYLNLPDTYGRIEIGDYVWIGEGAIIMQGVKIGTGG